MKFESYSFEDLDKEKWVVLENETRHLSVWQTYLWAKVLSSTGIEPRFFMTVEKGVPFLGLLTFKSRFISNFLCGYETRRGPMFVLGVDKSVFRFFAHALKDVLKKESALYFYWEPPLYVNLDPYVFGESYLAIPSATFVVDLSPSVETLWMNLEGRARRAVKKAKRSEVNVMEAKSWSQWEEYYNLYVNVCYQKHIRPRSIALHKAIYNFLFSADKAKLFVAEHHGKMIGGIIYLVTPYEMLGYEGIFDARYQSLSPNSAVHWYAICWAKNQGIKYYDFGGALRKPEKKHFMYSIHLFKRQWGGNLHKYNCFALNKLYVIGRNLTLENSSMRWLYFSLERLRMIQRFDRI